MPLENQRILDFYKVAQQRDFARDFQFRVIDVADQGASILTQDDLVYARSANLPARAVANQAVPYMGLQFNVPGAGNYPGSDAYEIQFYADGEHNLRQVFETWSNRTFDDATSSGEYSIHGNSIITLAQLNQQYEVQKLYRLFGVYPVQVGSLDYDMTGNGAVVNFTCQLAYQFWRLV